MRIKYYSTEAGSYRRSICFTCSSISAVFSNIIKLPTKVYSIIESIRGVMSATKVFKLLNKEKSIWFISVIIFFTISCPLFLFFSSMKTIISAMPNRAYTQTGILCAFDLMVENISVQRREAFDHLVGAWSAELGAMSFAESVKLLDLMFLVAVIENRSLSESLSARIRVLEEKVRFLEERIAP